MGFGKTLTMISLIATDVDAEKNTNTHIEDVESDTGKQDVPTTLVIIPPPSM
jgi:SNF2 family DNA or RNA helicase